MAAKSRSGLSDGAQQAGLALAGGLGLVVEKGMHAGATASSRNGVLTIGSNLENDVVLISDNLVPHHARISISDAWRGILRIEAKGAPVRAADGRVVDQGRYLDLPMPARFQIGGAEFRASPAHDIKQARKFALPVLVLAGLALLLPSITGAVTGLFQGPSSLIASQAPAPIMVSSEQSEKWLEALRARLRETGLTGQVSVERNGAGGIAAQGTVDPASLDKWRDVIKWYDTQAGAPLLLNNVTRAEANAVLPAFRAVWLDAKPQVVLLNGQTAGVGDTIGGGWKIDAIDPSGVILSRDGRTSKVAF